MLEFVANEHLTTLIKKLIFNREGWFGIYFNPYTIINVLYLLYKNIYLY